MTAERGRWRRLAAGCLIPPARSCRAASSTCSGWRAWSCPGSTPGCGSCATFRTRCWAPPARRRYTDRKRASTSPCGRVSRPRSSAGQTWWRPRLGGRCATSPARAQPAGWVSPCWPSAQPSSPAPSWCLIQPALANAFARPIWWSQARAGSTARVFLERPRSPWPDGARRRACRSWRWLAGWAKATRAPMPKASTQLCLLRPDRSRWKRHRPAPASSSRPPPSAPFVCLRWASMLLAIDVSNSSTKLGVYDGARLLGNWRIDSELRQTADEYGLLITGLMTHHGVDARRISAAIMSNVVPPLIATFEEMVEGYFGQRCIVVSHELDVGLAYRTDNPAETGADRIVNCLAAHRLYGGPSVVVKFGTATTFDAVSADGAFLGGAITAGLGLAAEALASKAARLYKVEMTAPPKAVATDTIGNLQSGLVYGYVGLVEGLIERFKGELGPLKRVVATGWEAQYIAPLTKAIDEVNPLLTLEGLRLAWEHLCASRAP